MYTMLYDEVDESSFKDTIHEMNGCKLMANDTGFVKFCNVQAKVFRVAYTKRASVQQIPIHDASGTIDYNAWSRVLPGDCIEAKVISMYVASIFLNEYYVVLGNDVDIVPIQPPTYMKVSNETVNLLKTYKTSLDALVDAKTCYLCDYTILSDSYLGADIIALSNHFKVFYKFPVKIAMCLADILPDVVMALVDTNYSKFFSVKCMMVPLDSIATLQVVGAADAKNTFLAICALYHGFIGAKKTSVWDGLALDDVFSFFITAVQSWTIQCLSKNPNVSRKVLPEEMIKECFSWALSMMGFSSISENKDLEMLVKVVTKDKIIPRFKWDVTANSPRTLKKNSNISTSDARTFLAFLSGVVRALHNQKN